MYTIAELNDFIMKHTDAKYFDADVKLYKKHFPNSKLIAELDRCPDYAKRNLDERMLYELLSNQDSCMDCIWENRGFIPDGTKLIAVASEVIKPEPIKPKPVKSEPIAEEAINNDLSKMTYNQLKKTVFDLGLDKDCPNHKADTYRNLLANYMQITKGTMPQTTEAKKKGRAKSTPE